MSTLKNVAVVGASGSMGSVIFQKLVDSGKFKVRVLRRHGSASTFPEGTDVVDVDFSSVDSLTAALQDQDVVVCAGGTATLPMQPTIIDAALAAGVQRFLPSEFGSNLDVPNTRKLPVFAYKIKTQDYLIEKAKTTGLTYTFVYNNAFLDWGLQKGFIFKVSEYKPFIVDGGNSEFSATTLASVGDAVVGVLTHPEETKNRAVYISDTIISQNKLLELAKSIAPEKPWEPVYGKIDDMVAEADARLAKGLLDAQTFVPYLFRSVMDPAYGGKFEKTDNELLGVKGVTDDDIVALLKPLLK